jgi:Cdc6-like AAA superfamily ATPase
MISYRNNVIKATSEKTLDDFQQLEFDKRLQHPYTMMTWGMTGSGKTQFVKKLLERQEDCIDESIYRIFYHYAIYQPVFDEMKRNIPNLIFRKGLPRAWEKIPDGGSKAYIIVLDLMHEALKEESTCKLYTQGSHHKNISVITLTQNLFPRQKEARTISINCHYLILFRNPRDKSQIKTLATQLSENKKEKTFFLDVYKDATTHPFSYLMVDCKPATPEEVKFRSNVLEPLEHAAYLHDSSDLATSI